MNTDIINDLGADTLDMVDIVIDLEDEFEIEIPDDDVTKKFFRIGHIVDYIEEKLRVN